MVLCQHRWLLLPFAKPGVSTTPWKRSCMCWRQTFTTTPAMMTSLRSAGNIARIRIWTRTTWGDYPWPCYIRSIQGHSGCDPDLMGRVEHTEEAGEHVSHCGGPKDYPSVLRNGLAPGWYGTRTEAYLGADHPRTGQEGEPGIGRPVKRKYRTK